MMQSFIRRSGLPVPPPGLIAVVFVAYALVAVAILAVNMPPFQNADEPAHFLRAVQLADGHIIGERFSSIADDGTTSESSGGQLDTAVSQAFKPFGTLLFHPDVKATRDQWAPNVRWSQQTAWIGIPNTVLYPPIFYLPSIAGILYGRDHDLTVVQTLLVSRLLTGVAAAVLGAVAIAFAGDAAIWLFAILTLPMSLALMAACSQDALMLASSALVGAMLLRLFDMTTQSPIRVFVIAALLLALLGLARPPYAALGLLLLFAPGVRLRIRILGVGAIFVVVFAWSQLMAATVFINSAGSADADPPAQIALLWADPFRVLSIAVATLSLWKVYVDSFIGLLGWLDTPLPRLYYHAAWIVLGMAALAAALRQRSGSASYARYPVIMLTVLVCIAAVFASLYITGTRPGNATVSGVSGRYFLPIALFAAPFIPPIGSAWTARIRWTLTILVLMFPVVSLGVVTRAVVLRYYLG